MRSFQCRLAELVLRLTRSKSRYASEANLRKSVNKNRKAGPELPHYPDHAQLECGRAEFHGRPVYTIRPQGESPRKQLLYFHGGAYVHGVTKHHWQFVGKLARGLSANVTVPLYPLAPEHQATEVFDLAIKLYEDLLKHTRPEDLIIAGDSAGGGLALSLVHQLRERGIALPSRLLLVSPWLDAELNDPEIPTLERHDPMISVPGLRAAGRWYAGDIALNDPRISPIHMDLEGLPPTQLLIGTHDILWPDARKFREKALRLGAPLSYYEYPEMFHDWALTSILPEAKRAVEQIVGFQGL